jgi:hypothetical protein
LRRQPFEGIGLQLGRTVPIGSLVFLVHHLIAIDSRFDQTPIQIGNFLVYPHGRQCVCFLYEFISWSMLLTSWLKIDQGLTKSAVRTDRLRRFFTMSENKWP